MLCSFVHSAVFDGHAATCGGSSGSGGGGSVGSGGSEGALLDADGNRMRQLLIQRQMDASADLRFVRFFRFCARDPFSGFVGRLARARTVTTLSHTRLHACMCNAAVRRRKWR